MQDTLSDIAYKRIHEMVVSGELKPGSRLVNRTLGQVLGVSTIPVREALRRLASEGFAEHIPGAGTFVRRFDRIDLIKLYGFREAIECHAASEAARYIQPDQLRRLDALCDRFHALARTVQGLEDRSRSSEEFKESLEIDLAFHKIIIEAADNPWLSKAVHDTRLMARIALTKSSHSLSLDESARTLRHHAALVRALHRGDQEWAVYWMRRQIRVGLDSLLERIEKG